MCEIEDKKGGCSLYNLPAFHVNVDLIAVNRAKNQIVTVSSLSFVQKFPYLDGCYIIKSS